MSDIMNMLLDRNRAKVECETCRLVFVDVSYTEFIQKHRTDIWDKWFCDALLHWLQNPTHEIMSNLPNAKIAQEIGQLVMKWSLTDLMRIEYEKSPVDLPKAIMDRYNDSRSRDF